MIIYTGSSRHAASWQPVDIEWPELAKRLSDPKRTKETVAEYQAMTRDDKAEAKDVGGFVAGEIYNGIRKKANIKNRCMIVLDIDYGDAYVWDDLTMLLDYECLMHTTHSHTPAAPRYRLFFPLAHVISPDQYEPIGRKLAELIGLERFDSTTYDYARLMYWPSCPSDGEFKVWEQHGRYLDPAQVLADYKDWRDQSEWPRSRAEEGGIRNDYERKARQENPLHKGGVVGAFCRVYDIPGAIEKYLPDKYTAVSGMPDRYTYTGGTTTGGMVVYDNGLFAYSHHDTDPAHGRSCNAYDLVRIHKFGDTEDSAEQMKRLCHDDEAVRHELEIIAKETANTEFEESNVLMFEGDYTEQGNSNILYQRAKDILRWHPSTGWLFWDGVLWSANAETEALSLVKNLNDDLLAEAKAKLQTAVEKKDQSAAKALAAWAGKSRKYSTISGVIKLASAALKLRNTDDLDRDPWLINTPDAIFDLHDGRRIPHESGYMCTKVTAFTPDWQKPAPMWHDFLRRVTGDDKEFEQYLQMVAGMACVGKVYEEGIVIAYGPGGNGKSTLFSIWKMVLGSYAGTVRNELLMGQKNGAEVAGQLQLRGLRLAITGELEESSAMQISLLKKLASRDDISARALYHEPMIFTPSHTLVLHTNHLPTLRSLDEGTRRRIAICPFTMKLKAGETVMDFAGDVVRAEGPQIMAWMIDGANRFAAAHMHIDKPGAVVRATEAYFSAEDRLGLFIAECCELGEDRAVQTSAFYAAYRKWYEEQGFKYAKSQKDITKQMEDKGYQRKKTETYNVYRGLDLKEEYAI